MGNPNTIGHQAPLFFLVLQHIFCAEFADGQVDERFILLKKLGQVDLLAPVMEEDIVSEEDYVKRLAAQLASHYQDPVFESCDTMGELVYHSIMQLLGPSAPATDPHTSV